MIGFSPPVPQSLLLAVLLAAPAAAKPVPPEMDKLLLAAVDDIYNMQFEKAEADLDAAQKLDPGYPHPYLGRAAVDLIKYSYGTEQSDQSLISSFEKKIAQTIAVAEKRLKEGDPKDPQVLFVLGAAHGISGRMAIVRRQWLKAFSHGRASMKSVRLAAKLDPELYDAQLGLGMFDYYVATIPKFAGWLAKVMLGGDRARGMKEIEVAAAKGHYARTAAQLILVEIYLEDDFGAHDGQKGLDLMTVIHAKYPESQMLHSAYVVALFEAKKYAEAEKEAADYVARIKSGKYPAMNLPKGYALLGTVLWGAGDKEGALKAFRDGVAAPDGGLRTRWSLWSRVREGQVLDALGRRDEALVAYQAAMKERDDWEYQAIAKPCLKKPCVGDKYPGHFSPY